VYRSTDNGDNWEKINKGIEDIDVTDLAMDGQYIYAGAANGVYRSSNQGENWEETARAFDNEYINTTHN
jgi:photosystem II stability/assembly factor-like uncharacterized protein